MQNSSRFMCDKFTFAKMSRFAFLGLLCIFAWCLVGSDGQVAPCGAVFTISKETSGTGQSNNSPYDMGDNLTCTWVFTGLTNSIVYIFVDMLDLDQDTKLNVTVNQIAIPLTPNDLIAPLALVVTADNGTIEMVSGNSTNGTVPLRRISFRWKTSDVQEMFSDARGVIESPKYIKTPGAVLDMSWIVTGKFDRSIAIAFEKFDLGAGTGYLDISQGKGEPALRLNGSATPQDIVVKGGNVVVKLSLPIDLPDLGFSAYYREVYPMCSLKRQINDTLTVQLDAVESKLPVKCISIFEGPANSTLSAVIVDVVSPGNASDSFVTVRDGGSEFSKSIGVFMGSALPINDTMLASGNLLWISYSFHDGNVPNITLDVSVLDRGSVLRNSGSFGVKPSAPNATLPSNTSVWSLVVDTGKQVRVNVQVLTMDANDRVSFYEGNAAVRDRLLATFDSKSTLIPIVSKRNIVLVVVESFGANSTFQATFTGSSDENYVFSSTVSESHQLNHVEANSNFTWIIQPTNANATDLIEIKISMLSVKPNISSLLVYEGVTAWGTPVANVTTVDTTDFAIFVGALKGAVIVYRNIGSEDMSGVLLDGYYAVRSSCYEEWNITANETRIVSPLYPKMYPTNADCTFILSTSPNKSLLLSFEDVDLADGHFLALVNGTVPVYNLTGNASPDDYISSRGARLLVKFVTHSMPTNVTRGRGFSIRVQPLDCGGHVTDAQNSMTTPGWPDALPNSTMCVWSIELPKSDKVGIVSLDIEDKPVPSSPALLKFVDGGIMYAGLSTETINASTEAYLSRTSKMMIVYNYTQTDPKVLGTPYKFSYTTKDCPASELCMNGVCMHPTWRCNGINDCGDFTDEYNCTGGPIVQSSGVSVSTFVVFLFIMFFTGVGVAMVAPNLYRRIRSPRHYQSFGGAVDA